MSTVVENLMAWWTRGRASMLTRRIAKQMRLVETLSLGGRRQLLLVTCGERKFLVGAGSDGVQSIVEVCE